MIDPIDRQAAIDCVTFGAKPITLRAIRDRLAELPSVQSEQRWIPCSEGLPKNNDPVNVTWVNRDPEPYYESIKGKPFVATAHYHKGIWYWYSCVTQDYLNEYGHWEPDRIDASVEILAWQPMPEPYKGGQDGKAD